MALNIVSRTDDMIPIRRVIVSVSDKTGLETFVPGLLAASPGVVLYSTGGTHTSIAKILGPDQSRRSLVSIADYTGQPEMQGGLVKTLDFKIYLGLLSETYNEAHQRDLSRTQAVSFDMVVVNLYPFREAVATPGATAETARTNIDIGGPCMVRASAKNFIRVASVTDPRDYGPLVDELKRNQGALGLRTRLLLSQKAFAHTAAYDTAIAAYLGARQYDDVAGCYKLS